MRPEDWRKGMENEAASVEDEGWAREARRLARRHRWLADALLSLGAASILAGVRTPALVLIFRFGTATPSGLGPSFIPRDLTSYFWAC